jgi:multiple sugar transport system permease protein
MSRRVSRIFLLTVLSLGVALSIVPFFWLVRSSFMNMLEIYTVPPLIWAKKTTLDNYHTVFFADVPFFGYVINTLTITLPVILGTVLTSSMAGYGFARFRFPFKRTWFALCISTMLIPGAVTMIPLFLIWQNFGQINTYTPLILPAFLGGGAFNIFLFRQFFMTIPRELDESARIDGASYVQIFVRILFPLLTPVVIVVALFTFMGCWNDFFGPLLYLYDMKKYTIALGLQLFTSAYGSDYGAVMAGAVVMTIPSIIIFFIGQRYFVQGIVMTGLKV